MTYLTATLVTIVAVELFFRLRPMGLVDQLSETLKKVVWVMMSKSISDHWKEKVLLIYSGRIALITLKIAALIGGIGLFVLVFSGILDKVFSLPGSTVDLLMSWLGLSLATVASVAYYFLRRRIVS
ncbi:hypothetical protein ACFL3A_00175 [Pseudomonadota bacterium]